MNTAICTLFEGDFHFGLGALANSLDAAGFRGTLCAGFCGSLPRWAAQTDGASLERRDFAVGKNITVRFLPVTTKRHLTNYKPDFMLDLWEAEAEDADTLFYIDPDIIVRSGWDYFEEWVSCGVALCEDINSPLNPTHPLRIRWKEFYAPHGINLKSSLPLYVNGGFIGLKREHRVFLEEWRRIQELMAPHTNNLQGMNLLDRTFIFRKTDQDAMNIALYSTDVEVSVMGQEAMDFRRGGYTMSHATGRIKPWRKSMIANALRGQPPTLADKAYWKHVDHPLRIFGKPLRLWKQFDLAAGAMIGRFIRRS